MRIRPFTGSDGERTVEIFQRAIRELALEDYSSVQREAWAQRADDLDQWNARRIESETFVAEVGSVAAGFSDVSPLGYIHMMFVHPDFARQGIATALLEFASTKATNSGAVQLSANVSLTARPLFERHGFVVQRTQQPEVSGVAFTNFHMTKPIR